MNQLTQRLHLPHNRSDINVGDNERWLSLASGVAMVLTGLRRRGMGGALMGLVGTALLKRGYTGYCEVNGLIGRDTAHSGEGYGDRAQGGLQSYRSELQYERQTRPWQRPDEAFTRHPGDIKDPTRNRVDEASEESFPASDPPSYTGAKI